MRPAVPRRRPKVFLCNIGPLARLQSARGFLARLFQRWRLRAWFHPKVFPARPRPPWPLSNRKRPIAVICSTDENYPALVPPLVQAIRAQRKDAIIVLAGFPQDQIEAHKQAGVDEFIHIRADALELLTGFHRRSELNYEHISRFHRHPVRSCCRHGQAGAMARPF